jgi:beta-lactamase class A
MDSSLKLSAEPGPPPDPGPLSEDARLRQELRELDEKRTQLDRRIADAVNRQRFSPDRADAEKARDDERKHLAEMDRLMTRIRAVEGKLLLLRRRNVH